MISLPSVLLAASATVGVSVGGAWAAGVVWRKLVPVRGNTFWQWALELGLAAFGGLGTAGVITVGLTLAWGGRLGTAPTSADDPAFQAALFGTAAAHLSLLAWGRRLGYGLAAGAPSMWGLAAGPLVGLLGVALSAGWSALAEAAGYPIPDQALVSALEGAEARAVFDTFIVGVAPLLEELVFRGFLFGAVAARYGAGVSIVSTGFLFGVFHMTDPGVVPPLAVLGVLFGILRHRAGSVWPCVLAHMTNNAVALLV